MPSKGSKRLEWCECCARQRSCYPVCIDDNMETYLCPPCLNQVRKEAKVEIMENM